MTTILNKITLRECRKLSEAEILLRNIPQDNTAGHVEAIVEKINKGIARVVEIKKDDKKIGFFIYEVYEGKLWVLAMASVERTDVFQTVVPSIKQIAINRNCKKVCFETVRAGLVETALKNGFYISSVQMHTNV